MEPLTLASLTAAGFNPANAVGTPPAQPLEKGIIKKGEEKSLANVQDLVSYSLANGTAPFSTKQGRILMKGAFVTLGQKQTQDLVDSILIFNKRNDIKKMSGKERINAFYDIKHDNPNVETIKSKLKLIGYSPDQSYNDSPDLDIQDQLATR